MSLAGRCQAACRSGWRSLETAAPRLGLDKRGRPFRLHRRFNLKQRVQAEATAKAEGARGGPVENAFKNTLKQESV